MSQWADKERVLSSEANAEAGRWDTSRAPFQREIMDTITDPAHETIAVMSSAQVGKTEILLNTIGYFVQHDPSPIMAVQPSLVLAEAFSKDRIAPMFRDTPALRGRIGGARARDGDNTLLHKKFPGGHLTMAGANSPSSLASRPIRILIGDEVDRYPKSAGKEGDPVKLASKRTNNFWNRKKLFVSTPTIEGDSRIEDEWKGSDQRRYHVPCPLCGHRQHLVWENLKWKAKEEDPKSCDPQSVRYQCEACKGLFADNSRSEMLAAGRWVAAHPGRKTAGFHLNELYSPWRRWREVVDDYLDSKDDPAKLMVWWNTSLGLPFSLKAEEAMDWEVLYQRRVDRPLGVAPRRAVILTCAVDVQKDRLEAKIVGWNRRQSWVVDKVEIPGDTSLPPGFGPWVGLDALLAREIPHESGRTLRIACTLVDSGFQTMRVYEFVKSQPPGRVFAIKGKDTLDTPIGNPAKVEIRRDGRRSKGGTRLWHVGTDLLKTELMGRLRLKLPRDTELEAKGYPPTWIDFPMLDEEYFRQLTAEELVMVPGAKKKRIWRKVYPNNEQLDLYCYNIAAWHKFGCDKMTDEEWRTLEADMGMRAEPAPAAEPTQNTAAPAAAEAPRRRRSSGYLRG